MNKVLPFGISVTRRSPTTIDVSDSEGLLAILDDITLLEAEEAVCVAADKHDALPYIKEIRALGLLSKHEYDRTILAPILQFAALMV